MRLRRWAGRALLLAVVALVVTSLYVEYRYRRHLYGMEDAPSAPVALVFGAGLTGDSPSPLLAERLDAAINLYRSRKVERLLLSGNSGRYHNEPAAMRRYVLAAGVPQEAIWEDGEGLNTFDSCRRARVFYRLDRVLLVTQRFHLTRALFLARSLGLDAEGIAADSARPRAAPYPVRELFARPLALFRIWFHRERGDSAVSSEAAPTPQRTFVIDAGNPAESSADNGDH